MKLILFYIFFTSYPLVALSLTAVEPVVEPKNFIEFYQQRVEQRRSAQQNDCKKRYKETVSSFYDNSPLHPEGCRQEVSDPLLLEVYKNDAKNCLKAKNILIEPKTINFFGFKINLPDTCALIVNKAEENIQSDIFANIAMFFAGIEQQSVILAIDEVKEQVVDEKIQPQLIARYIDDVACFNYLRDVSVSYAIDCIDNPPPVTRPADYVGEQGVYNPSLDSKLCIIDNGWFKKVFYENKVGATYLNLAKVMSEEVVNPSTPTIPINPCAVYYKSKIDSGLNYPLGDSEPESIDQSTAPGTIFSFDVYKELLSIVEQLGQEEDIAYEEIVIDAFNDCVNNLPIDSVSSINTVHLSRVLNGATPPDNLMDYYWATQAQDFGFGRPYSPVTMAMYEEIYKGVIEESFHSIVGVDPAPTPEKLLRKVEMCNGNREIHDDIEQSLLYKNTSRSPFDEKIGGYFCQYLKVFRPELPDVLHYQCRHYMTNQVDCPPTDDPSISDNDRICLPQARTLFSSMDAIFKDELRKFSSFYYYSAFISGKFIQKIKYDFITRGYNCWPADDNQRAQRVVLNHTIETVLSDFFSNITNDGKKNVKSLIAHFYHTIGDFKNKDGTYTESDGRFGASALEQINEELVFSYYLNSERRSNLDFGKFAKHCDGTISIDPSEPDEDNDNGDHDPNANGNNTDHTATNYERDNSNGSGDGVLNQSISQNGSNGGNNQNTNSGFTDPTTGFALNDTSSLNSTGENNLHVDSLSSGTANSRSTRNSAIHTSNKNNLDKKDNKSINSKSANNNRNIKDSEAGNFAGGFFSFNLNSGALKRGHNDNSNKSAGTNLNSAGSTISNNKPDSSKQLDGTGDSNSLNNNNQDAKSGSNGFVTSNKGSTYSYSNPSLNSNSHSNTSAGGFLNDLGKGGSNLNPDDKLNVRGASKSLFQVVSERYKLSANKLLELSVVIEEQEELNKLKNADKKSIRLPASIK